MHEPPAPERNQIGTWTHIVSGLLSPTECAAIIDSAESKRFQLHHSRSRQQITFQSIGLSECVWHSLQRAVPTRLVGTGSKEGQVCMWELHGLAAMWRLTKDIAPTNQLKPHFDAVKCVSPHCCTGFTLMIYLNDVPESDGGAISFEPNGKIDENMHVASLQPRSGVGMVLAHDV